MMHRYVRAGLALALITTTAMAAGCASSGSETSGFTTMEVWGYVASADDAQLEVEERDASRDSISVTRVVAPGPAWVVVHLEGEGMTGEPVGLLRVDEGRSSDLEVPLEKATGDRVIVCLHADEGTEGEFEFDMMNKQMSPDRAYFVDRKELTRVVTFAK